MSMDERHDDYNAIDTESRFNTACDNNNDEWLSACQGDYMNSDWLNQAFKDTKLYETIENQCFKAPEYRRFEVADLLLKQGANANGKIDGMYLIEKAIDKKNGPMFIEVLANGATIPHSVNVDFVSVHGIRSVYHTPLFYLVSTLLDNCIKTPRSNDDEEQFSRLRQLIEKLIDAGADINYKNGDGKTPHDLAQAHPEAASLLQAGFDAGEAQVSSTYGAVTEANIATSASNDKYATIVPILMFGVGLCVGLSAYYFIGLSALLSVGVAL